MAKSQIIKDLTSGVCSLSVALKRLYVILSDLNDEELQLWVRKELNGYSGADNIPDYRQVTCIPMGSYEVVGYGKIFTYNNQPLPMIKFDSKLKRQMTHCPLSMSVDAISQSLLNYKNGTSIGIPIPMEMWPLFQQGTTITITRANRTIDESEIRRVLNNIESKVLDLLVFLEKKFGNLDDLDISVEKYDNTDLSAITNSCKQIIFENCTFQNVDNTKIKTKNIATDNAKIDNKKATKKIKNSNIGKGRNHVEKHIDVQTDVDVNW